MKAALTAATWRGWITLRPPNPWWRNCWLVAANASSSSKSTGTGPTGGARPAAADATTTALRIAPNSEAPGEGITPKSAHRSASPKARRTTGGVRAIRPSVSTPSAVSTRACTGTGLAAHTSATALGITAPAASDAATMARSSASRSSRWLTRTHTGTAGGRSSQDAAAARASDLAPGGTASSRSTMTASAPLAAALSNRSGRWPGTYR